MEKWVKEFWENEFGTNEVGYDFAGYEVRKSYYGQTSSEFGWDIDHILPSSMGGTDHYYNLQITQIDTNNQRGNRMSFWIDGDLFQVKKISRLCVEDEVADYPYNGKKYCIIILEEAEVEEQYYNDPWHDDD
jgi:hypothetical protein